MKTKRNKTKKSIRLFSRKYALPLIIGLLVAFIGISLILISRAASTNGDYSGVSDTFVANAPVNGINYSGKLCESFSGYCLDSPNFRLDASVTAGLLSSARNIAWKPDGGTFCYNGSCFKRGTLNFTAADWPRCATWLSYLALEQCTGVDGVNWAIGYARNNHLVFINDNATRNDKYGRMMVLSGTNDGQPFSVHYYGKDTFYQKFDFQ